MKASLSGAARYGVVTALFALVCVHLVHWTRIGIWRFTVSYLVGMVLAAGALWIAARKENRR